MTTSARLCSLVVASVLSLAASGCSSAQQPTAAAPVGARPTVSALAPAAAGPSPSLSAGSLAVAEPPITASLPPALPTATPAESVPTTTSSPGRVVLPGGPRARVVARGRSDRPLVALTFDAGADTGNTARILDVLAAERVAATFGLTGRWVEANPALARRIAAEGHQLVNHTDDHSSFTGVSTHTGALSQARRSEEVARAEQAIQRVTGTGTAGWFRPPYGDRDAGVDADVGAAGYGVELMWSVDSLGWAGHSVDDIVNRVLASAGPGMIALFHVGAASADAAALPRVISGLRSRGFGFGTAAQVVAG